MNPRCDGLNYTLWRVFWYAPGFCMSSVTPRFSPEPRPQFPILRFRSRPSSRIPFPPSPPDWAVDWCCTSIRPPQLSPIRNSHRVTYSLIGSGGKLPSRTDPGSGICAIRSSTPLRYSCFAANGPLGKSGVGDRERQFRSSECTRCPGMCGDLRPPSLDSTAFSARSHLSVEKVGLDHHAARDLDALGVDPAIVVG
jgi:hypothetical protein